MMDAGEWCRLEDCRGREKVVEGEVIRDRLDNVRVEKSILVGGILKERMQEMLLLLLLPD